MDKKQLVFFTLRKKAKALGFSRKELESAAATIADNLEFPDDISDEDKDSAVSDAVDAAMPFLKISQSSASRQVKAYMDAHKTPDDASEGDDEGGDDTDLQEVTPKKAPKASKSANADSEVLKLLQALNAKVDSQAKEISSLKEGKVSDTRMKRLESMLKGTGSFGERTLRNYKRMSFSDENDFEEFVAQVNDDLKSINKERADSGLEKLGVPPATIGTKQSDKKEEPLTDEEIDRLADSL